MFAARKASSQCSIPKINIQAILLNLVGNGFCTSHGREKTITQNPSESQPVSSNKPSLRQVGLAMKLFSFYWIFLDKLPASFLGLFFKQHQMCAFDCWQFNALDSK